jgi:hypothetical protein
MRSVEVTKNGIGIGTVSFRGIVEGAAAVTERRRFRCSPKDCIPKSVVKKIADRLAFGVIAGHEDDYEWHT